jgi:Zn finger protein HypA/HybF involved in hydrogenase expression
MLITCDKCNNQVEAAVTAKAPHRVICPKCKKQIDSITQFVIGSLVRDRKFIAEEKEAFSFYCEKDKGSFPGVLKKDANGKDIVNCSKCGTKMNVTEFMILQLKASANLKKT